MLPCTGMSRYCLPFDCIASLLIDLSNKCIFFLFVCKRKEILQPNAEVEAFVNGEHTNIATRNARGLDPPMRERGVARLKGGNTPIQAIILLSDVDAAVRPLLSQIQNINKAIKDEYPDMDTLQAALQALQKYVVNTQEDRVAGSYTDLKIVGMPNLTRCT